jgi:hypothetical protein
MSEWAFDVFKQYHQKRHWPFKLFCAVAWRVRGKRLDGLNADGNTWQEALDKAMKRTEGFDQRNRGR